MNVFEHKAKKKKKFERTEADKLFTSTGVPWLDALFRLKKKRVWQQSLAAQQQATFGLLSNWKIFRITSSISFNFIFK